MQNGSVLGKPCIYSRVDSFRYEIELISLEIKALSPTINIA